MSENILLVDDETDILDALQRLLINETYHVYTACSGQEALQIIQTHPIDLLISDYRMPRMNGVELLEAVQKISPQTISIILSAYSDSSVLLEAINRGKVLQFIEKPWNNADLKNTINKTLKKAAEQKSDTSLSSLITSIADYIVITDAHGHVITASH